MYQVGTTVYQYNPSSGRWEGIMSAKQGTYPSPNFSAPGLPYVPPAPTQPAPTQPAPTQQQSQPDNSQNLADAVRNAALDSVRRKWEAAKQTATDYGAAGQRTFDTLLKAVNDFRTRAGELKSSADQQITNTASDILGTNARNFNDTAATARSRARASGLGAGSRLGTINNLSGSFAALQGNTVAKRGENTLANTNLYNERMDTAQNQERQANDYLKGVTEGVQRLQTQGADQFGTDTNAADAAYGNSLNAIIQRQQALAALNPLSAGSISAYSPSYTGVANPLNSVIAGLNARSGVSGDQAATATTNPDIWTYLKSKGLVQ